MCKKHFPDRNSANYSDLDPDEQEDSAGFVAKSALTREMFCGTAAISAAICLDVRQGVARLIAKVV